MIRATMFVALAAVAAGAASPAFAQGLSEQQVVNDAIARACAGQAGTTISTARLAEAMIVAARLNALDGQTQRSALEMMTNIEGRANLLRGARALIQEQLATPGSSQAQALAVTPPPAPRSVSNPQDWLFASGDHVLTCAVARAPHEPQFTSLGPVVIRGSVDDLGKVGDDRRSAGAAQVGWNRSRVTGLTGTTKQTTTLTINAAAGLAIGNTDRFGILYGDYSRNRVRVRTGPGAPATGGGDDIDALELGILGSIAPARAVRITGRAGMTFDSITDARFLHGTLSLTPITGGRPRLGLCNLNSFGPIGNLGIEGRCTLAAEADVHYVLRHGTAPVGVDDTLAAFGGVIGFEFRRALDVDGNPQDGLVGSVSYRYLAMVDGHAPDIDRFEASIAYRWWAGDVGFDVGFNYADGINRKTFANENRVGFTLGIIY